MGFLEKETLEGFVGLLAIPGTSVVRTQAGHDVDEFQKTLSDLLAGVHRCKWSGSDSVLEIPGGVCLPGNFRRIGFQPVISGRRPARDRQDAYPTGTPAIYVCRGVASLPDLRKCDRRRNKSEKEYENGDPSDAQSFDVEFLPVIH